MLTHSIPIILFLLAIEISILYISSQDRFKKYFSFLPSIFWIYFLPMLASTAGIIDPKAAILQTISSQLLPMSLFLLLMTVDIKAIVRLGPPALVMFFAGSLGIMLGAPLIFFLFKDIVGSEMWSGFGALAGSWTGGSANMIAVKEALATPDAVFLPMVVVDTIVPYVWMGILVAFAGMQSFYDRWNKSDRKILDDLGHRITPPHLQKTVGLKFSTTIFILILGAGAGFIASFLAQFLPTIKDVISPYAWKIIIVSLLGICLSFSPVRKLEQFGSTKIGYLFLYFVLTSIGAKANLSSLGSALILIAAGFCLVIVHMLFLFLTSRIIKAPMFLIATACQANIGGVASAPIVAEIYQPGLASVGLLLAILGNIVGTYFGIMAGQIARFLAG